jgi:Tfp pilus assembly protein PilO
MNHKTDWVIWSIFILMQLAGLFVLAKMIRAKTDLLVEEKRQLTTFEQKENSLIKLQANYLSLTEIELIDKALPDKERIVTLVNQIEKEATSAGIEAKIVFGNRPINPEAEGGKSITLGLNLKGTYLAMVNFTKKLERMLQVLSIEEISLQSPHGLEGENNAHLVIKGYLDPNF